MRNRIVCIVLLASGTCAIAAVTLPKQGSYDVTSCWTGTSNDITIGKGESASSYEMLGTVVSAVPGGLGDQSSFRCVGTRTSIKGKSGGSNVCEIIDADGDKRFNRFDTQPDGKIVREMISGTGKYEGMEMTNTVAQMPPMKEVKPGVFQGCNRQSGTYKLK